MINIRPYKSSDLTMIQLWAIDQNMAPVWDISLPEDSTFVLEIDGVPALTACLYLMNSKQACMIEHLVGNPEFKNKGRREAVTVLFKYLEDLAKSKGYTNVVLFSYEDKLKDKYEALGYSRTLENVTTFSKVL